MIKRIVNYLLKRIGFLLLFIGALHPRLLKIVHKLVYEFMASPLSEGLETFDFLNYGYADLDPQKKRLALDERDEVHRLNIQLYHHIATAAPIQDLEVLEVGCGHGGGASYVMRYLKPKRMVGVDLSRKNISLCNGRHARDNLTFLEGDAEDLPFGNNEFDVVLNVESSHAYSSVPKFLSEVGRVLRPGGHLLFADLRQKKLIPILQKELQESGLHLLKEEDITENILKARDEFTQQAEEMIRNRMTLWGSFTLEFLAAKGTSVYKCLQDGRFKYLAYVLKKPEPMS